MRRPFLGHDVDAAAGGIRLHLQAAHHKHRRQNHHNSGGNANDDLLGAGAPQIFEGFETGEKFSADIHMFTFFDPGNICWFPVVMLGFAFFPSLKRWAGIWRPCRGW